MLTMAEVAGSLAGASPRSPRGQRANWSALASCGSLPSLRQRWPASAMASKSSSRWKDADMTQAAVDALVLGMGTFFLGGYAVGLILKFLTGRWD